MAVRRGLRGLVSVAALVCALEGSAQSPTYGPTGSAETLWTAAGKVNTQYQLGSQAQAALALYRANPQAFGGSPGKLRPGSLLTVPSAAEARAVSRKQAFDIIIGGAPDDSAPRVAQQPRKPAPPVAAEPEPVAPSVPAVAVAPGAPVAPSAPRDPLTSPPEPIVPVVTGVEILSLPDAKGRQQVAVVGSGFREGATLTFRHPVYKTLFAGRRPTSVTPTRVEYTGRLNGRAGWEVAVVNPDEPPTTLFAFSSAELGGLTATELAAAPAAGPAEQGVSPEPEGMPPDVAFAQAPEQAQVAQMLRDGQRADEVYKFLLPLEEQFAGDVDYDYALGVAALDSGRLSDAVLILQRAVANRPQFAGARMELARAYYALGDNESARREFVTLQDQQPPEDAARVIAQYMDAIDRRAESYQTSYAAFAELGAGYDSNANGGPDLQQFLGFTLDARNRASETNYYSAALGGSVSYPFAPHWRVLGLGQGAYRANPEVSFVDSQTLRAAAGLEWSPAPVLVSLVPSYTHVALDGQDNSTITAADLSASLAALGAQFGLSARAGQTRYIDALSQQDVDTTIYGLSVSAPLSDLPVQLGAAVTQGRDEPVETASSFGRDLQGLRAFAMGQLGTHHVMLSASTLAADYDKPFFGSTRADDQRSVGLAYEWTALQPQGWSLGGSVNYVDNSSSVALYDYSRIDAGLTLRREFK